MTVMSKVFSNLYLDSVLQMQLANNLRKAPGLVDATVIMATKTNLRNLEERGFKEKLEVNANNLIVVVEGDKTSCSEAFAAAEKELYASKEISSVPSALPLTSLEQGLEINPDANLALISVPGDYAYAEAYKALKLGLHVMLFSNNVTLEEELLLKHYSRKQQLLLMGPDCGTAIINGVPLGFANLVRRGKIGIVAAAGTGLQEVACQIDKLGAGVSQAIGTGGRDLSAEIGAITTLQAIAGLEKDQQTAVLLVVSKPPAPKVAAAVLERLAKVAKPTVVHFLGSKQKTHSKTICATSLAEAAHLAVSLSQTLAKPSKEADDKPTEKLIKASYKLAPTQKFLRGIFSGGTFCYEAQLIAQANQLVSYSNAPTKNNLTLPDPYTSLEHTMLDMGDGDFTKGKPHPMIDPSLRNQQIEQDARDPETAVILFDLVLGYGAHLQPAEGLLKVITGVQQELANPPLFIAHVCGTDKDPQNRSQQVAALEKAGVFVADNNAEAIKWALAVLSRLANSEPSRN